MTEDTNKNKVDLEKIITKYNIQPEELDTTLKQIMKGNPLEHYGKQKAISLPTKHVKFGVLSDLHIGHKNYRADVMDHAVKNFRKHGIEFIMMPGDILEGMSGREGHIYELSEIGATNQLNRAEEELNKLRQPIYGITASNSHDGWYESKNNTGLVIGPELEKRVKNFNFMGKDKADLIIDDSINIRMLHPGGGTAYAISYKLQKYLNSLSPKNKPDILLQGHYHKAMQMYYQGVHAFESGTLEEQTIFMEKIGTPAHVGYWIIDAWYNKKGIKEVEGKFVPFYD